MKIIPGRTIVLTKFNGGLLGLVTGTYMKKLEVETANGDYTEEAEHFVPICQLRKKADLTLYTSDEIIGRHKVTIMNALIRKVVSLAKVATENYSLRKQLLGMKRREAEARSKKGLYIIL